jgi:hypothetical protein
MGRRFITRKIYSYLSSGGRVKNGQHQAPLCEQFVLEYQAELIKEATGGDVSWLIAGCKYSTLSPSSCRSPRRPKFFS